MNKKNFNKGVLLTSFGSFWWGFFGVIYFKYISFAGHVEVLIHRSVWTAFVLLITTFMFSKWSIFKKILKDKKKLFILFISGFLIFINNTVAKKFKNYLEKYAVFFKTKIEFIDNAINDIEIIPLSDWKLDCIEKGFVEINESISEAFTPHELNYQNLGLISFEKGCFTGQEVIARMHYRGKLKFSLAKFSVNDENFLKEQDYVFDKDGKKLGQVVSEERNKGLITFKDKSVVKKELFEIFNLRFLFFINFFIQ